MSVPVINAAFDELKIALSPLFAAVDSEPRRAQLLALIGYDSDALDIQAFANLVTELQADYILLQTLFQHPATSLAELRTQLDHVKSLLGVLAKLKHLLEVANAFNANLNLIQDLTVALLGNYLQAVHPTLYAVLVLLEIVGDPYEHQAEPPVLDGNDQLVRATYRAYQLHFNQLGALFSDPAGYVKTHYYPSGLPTRAEAHAVADKLFPRLARLFNSVGLFASYGMSATDGQGTDGITYGAVSDELQRHMLTVMLMQGPIASFGFTLALSSQQDGNLGLIIAPFGTATYHGDFTNWLVEVLLTASINGLAIGPQGVLLDGSIGSFGATASVKSQPDSSGNAFLFGAPQGTHLAIGEVAFKATLQASASGADYGVLAQASKAKFVLRPEEAGGFLGSIIPAAGVSGAFDLGLGWSKAKGFYLLGSTTLKAHYTITNSVADRLLVIRGVDVGLTAAASKLQLSATASGRVKLGPVSAELTDIGATVDLTFPGAGGNLGVAQADVQFKYPTGVGIEVKSDLVNGGGYLYFDAPNHKYAGVANLKIKAGPKEINVNAIGLLQTQVPGHPDAYSLLLLLTATFGPIELGLGFKLSGLGGLVGVNRAANIDYLGTLARTQKLDTLLFPDNVMSDPAAAVALADSAFPAKVGRHTIGLMAQLGWGVSGSLISLDVALLVEFPEPLTIIMLGVLQASLPSKANELLKLRADFLGYVDFGAKKASFDATLSSSKLLIYSLSGGMAFRLFQGTNPVFVITAGGFHPNFQPPAGANLTGLQRITLALAPSNDLRLTLASYYAVTANTVQFGAHLDLYYRLCRGLHVEGHFGFDTLFQFNPFALTSNMTAEVAIKNGDSELLSLHLRLDVTGPRPWHFWGEVSFRIWFVKISVGINATIQSGGDPEPALVAPDVHAMLVKALAAPTSWEVEAPQTAAQPGGVVLRPVAATAGQPFLDPRGALVLRQHVAPFGLLLSKYGSGTSAPINGHYFALTELTLGKDAAAHTYKLSDSPAPLEAVREFFAPDQFTTLSEAQRLSLPSFQLLPSGLRLKSLAGLTSTTQVTRRVVAYEQKLLDGTSGGHRIKVEADQFRQLAKGGALGQAVAAARPSARAPQPVGWAEDTYAVANAADLTAYAGHAAFSTQVEAEQYRQAVVAAQPSLAPEVLVVPSYELAGA
ncbi:hypothetical protein GCM10027422_43490 [Hymenobacter arcticus]